MNHFFLDTSALVKRYVSESGSQWVNTLLSQSAVRAYISRLTEAEISAALTRRLPGTQSSQILRDFDQDVATTYIRLEVTNTIIDDAVQLTRNHRLRGCDSLQLATARQLAQLEPTLIFICSDRDLLAVAALDGLTVDNPELHS